MAFLRILPFLTLFSIVAEISTLVFPQRPEYVECVNSRECGKSQCCIIGMGRYTVPSCRPLLDYGDQCRPNGMEPENLNLTYPDGTFISLRQVYRILCPCGFGLTCDPNDGICTDPAMGERFNDLAYY